MNQTRKTKNQQPVRTAHEKKSSGADDPDGVHNFSTSIRSSRPKDGVLQARNLRSMRRSSHFAQNPILNDDVNSADFSYHNSRSDTAVEGKTLEKVKKRPSKVVKASNSDVSGMDNSKKDLGESVMKKRKKNQETLSNGRSTNDTSLSLPSDKVNHTADKPVSSYRREETRKETSKLATGIPTLKTTRQKLTEDLTYSDEEPIMKAPVPDRLSYRVKEVPLKKLDKVDTHSRLKGHSTTMHGKKMGNGKELDRNGELPEYSADPKSSEVQQTFDDRNGVHQSKFFVEIEDARGAKTIMRKDDSSQIQGEHSAESSQPDDCSASRFESLETGLTLLSKKMQCMHQQVLECIKKQGAGTITSTSTVHERLNSIEKELSDLKSMVSVRDSSQRKLGPSKKTPVLLHFEQAFNTEVIRKVFEKSIIRHIMNVSKDKDEEQYEAAVSFAINVLIFAVHPRAGETREKYKTNTGKCFSSFRRGITLSILLASQKNKFDVFDNPQAIVGGKCIGHLKQPEWLKPGVVKVAHINRAKSFLEEVRVGKKSSSKTGSSSTISNHPGPDIEDLDDVPNYVGVRLYKEVIDGMRDARFHSKSALFEELFYLFLSWKRTGLRLRQAKTKMSWYVDCTEKHQIMATCDIDRTDTMDTLDNNNGSSADKLTKANSRNIQKLTDLVTSHPEMILIISHDVRIDNHSDVKEEPTSVNSSQDEGLEDDGGNDWEGLDEFDEEADFGNEGNPNVKTLTRTLNLIDIAARFLSCYTGFVQHRTPITFLRADPDALRTVYLLAVMLRSFVNRILVEIEMKGLQNVIGSEMKTFNTKGLHFKKLLPTPSKQLSLMKTTLTKKMKEYNNINIKGDDESFATGKEKDVQDGTDVDAEEDITQLGVVTFD